MNAPVLSRSVFRSRSRSRFFRVERDHRALWVDALDDPVPTRNVHRAVDHLTAQRFDLLDAGVDRVEKM